ncbi:LysR substrate-binding domain-containing protein [Nocardia sp. NBC_01388]|uniref:LysR substrate-binding domain-containing protein n=1 Tax=Nocardia sp. NBC_01388 TaxID=2903596 RepID=UPI00324EAE65
MELRQLRYFVTVAEELHFGRAAERLHIAQPAVSQQVQRLERDLKVQLLERSPRRVRLTEAGMRFLPGARAVLAAADQARASVADLAGGRAEVFRLGTVTGLGERLDALLEGFAERAPQVRVELVALPVQERIKQVADGRLDAAFVRSPQDSPELDLLPAWDDPLVVALPARHALAARESVSLADLAALPIRLIERREHPALVDLVLSACQRAGFEPTPLPSPASSTLQDTMAAVGAGAPMWTVVYASNARLVHNPRVAFRPFAEAGMSLPIGLAVRSGAASPQLNLLVRLISESEQVGSEAR